MYKYFQVSAYVPCVYFLPSIMDTMMAPPSSPRPPPSPPPTRPTILLKKRKASPQAPQAGPSNTKKACTNKDRPKKPKKPHDWHLRKGDIPEDSARTKARRKFYNLCSCPYPPFRSHLSSTYALWGLVNQGSLPIAVTNIERTNYDARFSSVKVIKADVTAALNNHLADINKARDVMMMLHDKIRNEHGTITNKSRSHISL